MPDIVIVGGGVVGATAAWRATRRGASVVLVDAREPGRATDAGAGIVSPETDIRDATPTHPLSAAAQPFYPDLIATLEASGHHDTGYARCGKLVIAQTGEEAEWLAAYVALLRDPARAAAPADPDTLREVTREEARASFPPLGDVTA